MLHFMKFMKSLSLRGTVAFLSILAAAVCAIMYLVAFDRCQTALMQGSFCTGIIVFTVFLISIFDGAVNTSAS